MVYAFYVGSSLLLDSKQERRDTKTQTHNCYFLKNFATFLGVTWKFAIPKGTTTAISQIIWSGERVLVVVCSSVAKSFLKLTQIFCHWKSKGWHRPKIANFGHF